MSTDGRVDKEDVVYMLLTHTLEYYSATKMK